MLTREEVLYQTRRISLTEADAQQAADEYMAMHWQVGINERLESIFQFLVDTPHLTC